MPASGVSSVTGSAAGDLGHLQPHAVFQCHGVIPNLGATAWADAVSQLMTAAGFMSDCSSAAILAVDRLSESDCIT